MHCASWTGKVEAIRVLLAMGASVGSRNSHGALPLHQAVRNGKLQAVRELLLSGADVAATDNQGETALHEVRLGLQRRQSCIPAHEALGT